MSHPTRKQLKTTTEPVDIFPEDKNPIGSVVTKILSFRRTDRQTDRHQATLYRHLIDIFFLYFRDYIEFPAGLNEKFDLILVDGRARVAAAKSIIRCSIFHYGFTTGSQPY